MRDVPSSASTANERASPPARGPGSAYPGTPRWVKVGAIAAVVLVLLLVLIMVVVGGGHGPMRHLPSAGVTNRIAAIAVNL
jgi:hypothetical protein